MKVGIIRCQQTEIYCPATTCLLNATKGEGGFSESGSVEVIGVNSCGGCPGKQVYARAMEMKKRGAFSKRPSNNSSKNKRRYRSQTRNSCLDRISIL